MASGLGPLVSVVLFACLGNRWEVRHLTGLSWLVCLLLRVVESLVTAVKCFFSLPEIIPYSQHAVLLFAGIDNSNWFLSLGCSQR